MHSKFKKLPFFLFLLPLFFVMHGYLQYFGRVALSDTALLVIEYMGLCLLLASLSWLYYRDIRKASLFSFLLMSYFLFFGSLHDFSKNIFGNSLLVRYSFIFPVSLVFFILLFIYLKKPKNKLFRITHYLNFLMLLLILIDSFLLTIKINTKQIPTKVIYPAGLLSCDSCSKPDIYLIVADEYAGSEQLMESFGFDNSGFESELQQRGFHITRNAKSNYNSTPFSVASLLSMGFIDSLGTKFSDFSLAAAYRLINDNALFRWLQSNGYKIRNQSAFPLAGVPNPENSTFFISGTDLITLHTLAGRFNRDLRFNFITRFRIKSEIKKFVHKKLDINQKLINNTIDEARRKADYPRFLYLHLMMPHYPYLVNKQGEPDYNNAAQDDNRLDKGAYIEYLQYSNRVFLRLIDTLRSASPNAIIILTGDHGFRHIENDTLRHFNCFNAVYLPGRDYKYFYEGMTLVNEFRIILNSAFNQQLERLNDSTIFLENWW